MRAARLWDVNFFCKNAKRLMDNFSWLLKRSTEKFDDIQCCVIDMDLVDGLPWLFISRVVCMDTAAIITDSSSLTPKFSKSLQNPPESPWFDWIQSGVKRFEGRLWKDDWAALKADDIIIFICPAKRELTCRVLSTPRFESFGAAFAKLGAALVPVAGVNTADVVKIYGQYYKDEDVAKYGVVAIEVEPLGLKEL